MITYFTLTEAEYLEAYDLAVREQQRNFRRLVWLACAIAVVSGIYSLLKSPRPLSLATIPAFPIAEIVVGVVAPWLLKYAIRNAIKKAFLRQKASFTNVKLQLDDDGCHTSVPGIGEGVAEWGGISRWLEGGKVFVLLSGLLMRIIPKSALHESELGEVRSLLTEKIGPVGVARSTT